MLLILFLLPFPPQQATDDECIQALSTAADELTSALIPSENEQQVGWGKKFSSKLFFFWLIFLSYNGTIVNVRTSVPPLVSISFVLLFAFLIALFQEPPYQPESPVKSQVLNAAEIMSTGSVAVTELQVFTHHLFSCIFF